MKMLIVKLKYLLLTCMIVCYNQSFTQIKTVIIDDLTFVDGHYQYKGKIFTGLAFYKAKTGQFIAEVPLVDGRMHGKRICYNYRGKVLSKDKFKKGKGRMKIYYTNDHLKNEGILDNGVKEGTWKYYRRDGVLKAEEYWLKDNQTLVWEKYYNKLGLLESELIYKNGSLAEERYYDEKGEVFKTNNYLENK